MKPEEKGTEIKETVIDKNETVKLRVKDEPKKEQSFKVAHANAILSLRNSQWELSDDKFKWNGKELAKK